MKKRRTIKKIEGSKKKNRWLMEKNKNKKIRIQNCRR